MSLIRSLFLWIYVRPIPQLCLMLLGASMLFCWAHRAWRRRPLWQLALCLGLLVWAGAVACSTVAGRSSGETVIHVFSLFHSYQELQNGGNPEILRSNFMNLALFYPAGLVLVSLLPKKLPAWCRMALTLVLLTCFSFGIEYFQYRFSLGNAEADDVFHNALGALLGSLVGQISLDR